MVGRSATTSPLDHFLHRPDDPFEPPQFPAQAEDSADRFRPRKLVDRGLLDRMGHVLELVGNRQIAIDDEIEHRVQHIIRALRQMLGIGLKRAAQIGVGAL